METGEQKAAIPETGTDHLVIHHSIELASTSAFAAPPSGQGTPKPASKTVTTLESKDVSTVSKASMDFTSGISSSSAQFSSGWKNAHLPQVPFAQHEIALHEELDYSSRDHEFGEPKMVDEVPVEVAAYHVPMWLQWPLFYYPYNVNEWTSRLIALQAMGIAIAGIIERDSFQMRYVVTGLWIDYVARFFLGARGSLLGVIAEWVAYWLPRKYVPGAPKQFAAFSGAVFTGVAAAVWFWASDSHDGNHTGGAVVLGVFLGAAALEFFFNFCIGCWLFTMMTSCGMISDTWMQRANSTSDEYVRTAVELETRLKQGPPKKIIKVYDRGNGRLRQHPIIYKASTDAQKREDYNPVKHTRPSYFAFPMAVAGLACVYKICAGIPSHGIITYNWPDVVWYIISIVSAGIGIPLFFLYIAKAIVYPHKIVKDWNHPVQRHMFGCFPIIVLLWSFLSTYEQDMLAEVLFWIGGPIQMCFSIIVIGDFFRLSHDWNAFTPAWMMAPVGNLVAAFVLPIIHCGRYACDDYHYAEAAYLWFGIGAFMWVVMTTLCVVRLSFLSHLSDDLRPSIFLLFAAPALVSSAFVSINDFVFFPFAIATLFISIVIAWVCIYLIIAAYFGRQKFNMSYWGFAFPLDTIAIATLLYYSYHQSNETFNISSTAVVIASGIHVVLTAHTILGIITGTNGVWVPEEKFTPMSLMRLQHYAVREGLNILENTAELASKASSNKEKQTEQVQLMINEWRELNIVVDEHMKQEEEVIFRYFRHLFPSITIEADHEHDRHLQHALKISQAMERLEHAIMNSSNEVNDMLNDLTRELNLYGQTMRAHIEYEELHFSFIGKKYLSVDWQCQIIREMFLRTHTCKWPIILAYLLKRQWIHQRRVRIVQALRIAMPERIQLIGRMLYENLDPLLFDRISVDVPEIIPRHVSVQYYKTW